MSLDDPASIDPGRQWRARQNRQCLRVPIGVSERGDPVELDLKESAENGMGPHGLCIGATGSGKSEFLRTLVLGLIATHSPNALNLVLIDFKGGATFLGLEEAPHVAAIITNLAEELAMVDRMKDALAGEMNRRQELLRAAGNFANVSDYEKARLRRCTRFSVACTLRRCRRVFRTAQSTAGICRIVRGHRAIGQVTSHSPAAGQSAARRRKASGSRQPSFVSRRFENVLGERVPFRSRRSRCLSPAGHTRCGIPEVRFCGRSFASKVHTCQARTRASG